MRILVVGNANCDRVLVLREALRPGGRHPLASVTERTGGAGYHAGAAIARLGGEAVLSARIAPDARGDQLLADVRAREIRTETIVRDHPRTTPLEILVEPDGRRTILFEPGAGAAATWPDASTAPFDGLYVNTHAPMPTHAPALVRPGGPILAQLPLVHGGREAEATHPAPLVIASADERPDVAPDEVWRAAARATGGRVERLVLTDGPRPIRVLDAHGVAAEVPVRPISGLDTTGAGDFFAGALVLALARGRAVADACAEASAGTALLLEARTSW
ncbi:carbohydrate kinase family protein [Salinarimonas ramus]|uniref:Ribokinase n=1 Tax=Salinarimonas ramus TaxID=690164 RepID=A0A917Q5E6_9HYPH|nr:carbohydrate kinase family protein [Salinarimonas ramus]GGK25424.1 ribokinase [Salinarimonas ramus]